jgi:GxxExxY protein
MRYVKPAKQEEYPEEELTGRIIGAAIEVHKNLGPGLLDSAYQVCLAREMSLRKIPFEAEKQLPITYKGLSVDGGYRMDSLVEGKVVVELKAVNELAPIHFAQLFTYLKLTNCKVGLLINFNVSILTVGGVRRMAN